MGDWRRVRWFNCSYWPRCSLQCPPHPSSRLTASCQRPLKATTPNSSVLACLLVPAHVRTTQRRMAPPGTTPRASNMTANITPRVKTAIHTGMVTSMTAILQTKHAARVQILTHQPVLQLSNQLIHQLFHQPTNQLQNQQQSVTTPQHRMAPRGMTLWTISTPVTGILKGSTVNHMVTNTSTMDIQQTKHAARVLVVTVRMRQPIRHQLRQNKQSIQPMHQQSNNNQSIQPMHQQRRKTS